MSGHSTILASYLAEGWNIVSTTATSSFGPSDEEANGRTFLMTIRRGAEVRVLGYEHFVAIDDDNDPAPYRASFVKILAD